MKIIERTHPIWEEYKKIGRTPDTVGEKQFIYSSEKGEISLITLPNYFQDGITFFEIYCLEGNLFLHVERFNLKEDAEKRIKELLG